MLQAVHSGADLQSAAAAVMGYEQVTMKGKAISIAPIPGVATARLQSLLDSALLTSKALPAGCSLWSRLAVSSCNSDGL